MTPITDTETLRALCDRLADEPFITVDTEFLRERTYWPQLCLIQVAGAKEAAAIDPLAKGMDLQPLYALLANPDVMKVLHAARQDMEIFCQGMQGSLPTPIFDTQIAAQVVGLGENVSYESLIRQLLGVGIDKGQRFTDWSRRPLSTAQIEYALGDVIHLHQAYPILVARMEKAKRSEWIAEEMAELAKPSLYLVQPEQAWERIKFRASHARQLGRLQLLAAWREHLAQTEDLPRVRIVRDDILIEMATNLPKSESEMEQMRGFPAHLKRAWRVSLWETIQKAHQQPKEDYPPLPEHHPLPAQAESRLEMLKMLLRHCARSADVTPRLVAGKEELEWLARNTPDCEKEAAHPLLHGWRWEVFGQHAVRLLTGDLAIRLHPQTGDIVFE
jgi:ribonuclease D